MSSTLRRKHWLASFALLVWVLAPAFTQAQMIFAQSNIRIDSPELTGKEKSPKPPHPSVSYTVEVRGEDALRLEYIHTLNSLTSSTGVMITLSNPAMVGLPSMKVYTPVDVLFVADDGRVLQIMPAVTLGELTQSPQAHGLTKAFLFLKNGEAAARGFHPQDVITGNMFTPPLPVQE